MKRIHIHIGVKNLKESRDFYSNMFNETPKKEEKEYVQWILDDPNVNLSISTKGSNLGLDHLGIQVDSDTEMENLRENFRASDIATHSDGETVCCYARSDKSWLKDPSGISWETFYTTSDEVVYGSFTERVTRKESCCAPTEKTTCC